MRIKLLVVDDEVQIRAGIEKGIRWKELGITDVKSAPNGIEALEIIKKEQIDILITDIRMPGMDGLELAKRAKEMQESIHIIILSGFSEFDYAKQAIGIGVEDYLLKPIKVKELTDNVAAILTQIQESEKKKNMQNQQQADRSIIQCILSKNTDKTELLYLLEQQYGLKNTDKVLCVLFEPDTRGIREENEGREKIMQMLEPMMTTYMNDFLLFFPKQILYVMRMDLSRSRLEMIQSIQMLLQNLNNNAGKENHPTVSAAVSDNFMIEELPDRVELCVQLLNKRLYMGTGIVALYEEDSSVAAKTFYLENEEEIRQYVISFQYEEAEKYIVRYFQTMHEMKISSYDLIKGVCLTLKQVLFRSIREAGLDVEKVLDKNKNLMLEVPDLFTMAEYERWICNLYYLVLKGVSEHTERNVSNTVMTAAAYISTYYQNDLTVEELSAYVNKSKNYFSYLFKKEMKISFTEYLNRYRIEQACILLETTLDFAGEIGQKVGFNDEKYFSAVFKKRMGCSPSQYRKNRGLENNKN